jgi:hypothetical protein
MPSFPGARSMCTASAMVLARRRRLRRPALGGRPSNNRRRHAPSHGITRTSRRRRSAAVARSPRAIPGRLSGSAARLASSSASPLDRRTRKPDRGGSGPLSAASGALYLASAIALGLMLTGTRPPVSSPASGGPQRRRVAVFWLFAVLAAGALLPRPFTLSRPAEPPTGVSAPSAVRTPSPAPSVSPTP